MFEVQFQYSEFPSGWMHFNEIHLLIGITQNDLNACRTPECAAQG